VDLEEKNLTEIAAFSNSYFPRFHANVNRKNIK